MNYTSKHPYSVKLVKKLKLCEDGNSSPFLDTLSWHAPVAGDSLELEGLGSGQAGAWRTAGRSQTRGPQGRERLTETNPLNPFILGEIKPQKMSPGPQLRNLESKPVSLLTST